MPAFQVIPREAIGLGGPITLSDGVTPRDRMSNEPGLLLHYTGTNSGWGDKGDTPDEIRQIQRVAAASGRYGTGWEYNWVIDQDDGPEIYEYAGDRVAYHAAGSNHSRVGVLLLNDTDEPPTDMQIVKLRWLRAMLELDGQLAAGNIVQGHREVAATSCPGNLVMARIGEFRAPWVDKPTPPPEPKKVRKIKSGRFLFTAGDVRSRVADRVGVNRVDVRALESGFKARRIRVNGVSGAMVLVESGDGPSSLLKAADKRPSDKALAEFYRWNGGAGWVFHPGDRAFVPDHLEPRKKR